MPSTFFKPPVESRNVITLPNLSGSKSASSYDIELMKLLMAHAEQLARMLEIESANLFKEKTGVITDQVGQNNAGLFGANKAPETKTATTQTSKTNIIKFIK